MGTTKRWRLWALVLFTIAVFFGALAKADAAGGPGGVPGSDIIVRPPFTMPFYPADIPSSAVHNVLGRKCNLSKDFNAYGDDLHDDTGAMNAALAAWLAGTCNEIDLDLGKTYLIMGAIYSPGTPYTSPEGLKGYVQPPLTIRSDGPAWSGTWFGVLPNMTGALDLRYNGSDGIHPAKIDMRGSGLLTLEYLTIEDKGADHYPFLFTSNTSVHEHSVVVIGDTAQNCAPTCPQQDWALLGSTGYWASSVNITSGTKTLTIASGDDHFRPDMVGWNINLGPTATFLTDGTTVQYAHIASYVSPTQVTIDTNATQTVTNGTANYFPGDGHYSQDPRAPFQGYGTEFSDNLYLHIRRVATYGNYANGIYITDEETSQNTGCSTSDFTYCAPYYFDKASTLRYGNVIRGSSVELKGYPYAVYFGPYAQQNTVDAIIAGDGGTSNVGMVYFETSAKNNTVRLGGWIPPNTSVAAASGPGLAQNTVYSNGTNKEPTVLPGGLTVGGTFPNNTKTTVNGVAVFPNVWNAQGQALSQISDGGTVSSTVQGNSAIAWGSIGSLPSKSLSCWGSTASGSAYSCMGADVASIAGIQENMLGLNNTGSLKVAFDATGAAGFAGNVQSNGTFVSWQTGIDAIFGNGAPGTASLIKLSNVSGGTTQYTLMGSGGGTFGSTCGGGVAPSVFAVAGVGGTSTLCVNQNGDTGIGGTLSVQVNGVGSGLDHILKFYNAAATKPDSADSINGIYGYAPTINSGCASTQPVSEYWQGISGATAGNYGGYHVFYTKSDGACSGAEALVLDPQQHLFMPNDSAQSRFNTPGACTAGTTCVTYTWTFTQPFLTIAGAAEVPRCDALGVMDESDSTQIWVGNIKSVSSTAITFNIAPMLNVGTAHTLDVYAYCHDQSY